MVPPDNKQAFVDAICQLLTNTILGETISKNARTKVEGFDWEKVKHSWFRILNE